VKITKIGIENFCSIKKAEISPSGFNVFVGQNNHGKTNLFEAINWFYTGKGALDELRFGRASEGDISVEIEFSGVQSALATMKNLKNRESIQNVVQGADTICARRFNDARARMILSPSSNKWTEKNPTGFDAAFNDFLPVFEYVDTKIRLDDVSKFGKSTAIGSMLSGVLNAILQTSAKYREFREKFEELFASPESEVRVELNKVSGAVTVYIAKQFPDCTEVEFKILEPAFEELLKGISTLVDDGIKTGAAEKGDGMQRALMLAILQTYADYRKSGEALGKNFLFFIDEAELHLHPTAQRNLKAALMDVSEKGDQVFMNTHSSVLVADDHPDQRIFRVEKVSKATSIELISSLGKPAIAYELLGGSPADLLLPHNFLIVEGRSEFEFLSRVIERLYNDKPNIQIVYSEGDSERQRKTMVAISTLFNPLYLSPLYRDRLIILCDLPGSEKAKKDLENFKIRYQSLCNRGQLHVLPVPSLEEYYPRRFRKTPDEAAEMGKHPFLKRDLARHVGGQITGEEFEEEMSVVAGALRLCWVKSYQ
jgi:putative ATP-dependent endonuclease of the OLD family